VFPLRHGRLRMSGTGVMKELDAIGIGLAAKDHLVVTDKYPECDTKTKMVDYAVFGGGPIATAMVALSRWGLKTAVLSAVGDDEAGRFITRSLADEGVDTSRVEMSDRLSSPQPFIVIERTTGRRTIFEWPQGTGFLDWDESFVPLIAKSRFLLVDCRNVEVEMRAAEIIHGAGGEVMLDCGHPREGFFELVKHVDYLVLSHSFLRSYWPGGIDPSGALEEMAGWGPKVCGFTLGEKGSIVSCGGEVHRADGFEVGAVDSTGAGDIFHAGFLYGLIRGWSIERTSAFSNAAAALSCLAVGGRAGIPSLERVERMIESGSRRD